MRRSHILLYIHSQPFGNFLSGIDKFISIHTDWLTDGDEQLIELKKLKLINVDDSNDDPI